MNAAVALANRALRQERWAREKLAAHVARTLRIVVGPAVVTLAIEADGLLAATPAAPDLTLTISALRLPALLARPERWYELVSTEGDAALAATLAELAQTLPWFVEQELARWLGPIVGVRLADAGRQLLALPDYAAQRFSDSVASYVRDEAELAVRGSEVRDLAAQTTALDRRLEELATRIEVLAAAVKPR